MPNQTSESSTTSRVVHDAPAAPEAPAAQSGACDHRARALATGPAGARTDAGRTRAAPRRDYPRGSAGHEMTSDIISLHPSATVAEGLASVRARLDDAHTVYTIPVVDDAQRVAGVVSLRGLLGAESEGRVSELASSAHTALATESAEAAARRCADLGLLALPIIDGEGRFLGLLTIDRAVRILEQAETEDSARQGGAEPLRSPYLTTPVRKIVRSRIVWLVVLALGATLTVQVLSAFEGTIAEVTVLALFVPLLIGTGGNTGNQAATTVTRALALGDVVPRDIVRVLTQELRTGALLGLLLGALSFAVAGLAYDPAVGAVIGLTLFTICTLAAGIGGCMPLLARTVGVDPAVFSNPFISTFVDATGLVIYFLIARAVLGL